MLVLALGTLILFVGDKVVRPAVARNGTRLPFVWVLMACFGGFEAFGLIGLVIGPVALTLTRELWEQRVQELEVGECSAEISPSTPASLLFQKEAENTTSNIQAELHH